MLERFNLSFRLHDRKSFRNALIGIKNGQLMQSDMFSIVSMQMLRSDDFLQLLMELDEAQQEAVWSFIILLMKPTICEIVEQIATNWGIYSVLYAK